ncbi:MAG: DoxX family protein [Anaerolineales bacterium]|nr:DoxX family protein [Anaerolineales bacterium]
MSTILWIIQIILAIKLITAAFVHGINQSKPTMHEAIGRLGSFSRPLLYLVAAIIFIGSLGLILPGVFGTLTWITPVTATILAVVLLFSMVFHIKSREKPNVFVSIILAAFAAFIAYGRWVLAPF